MKTRAARVFSYIVFECLDIPVRHELELSCLYGFSNESTRNRMFSFADLNRIPNEAYRN